MADYSSATDKVEEGAQSFLAERKETRVVAWLSMLLGAVIAVITITWAIDLWLELGFSWFDEQAMIACLGLTLAIIFIRYPVGGGKTRYNLPISDLALAVVALAVAGYFVFAYPKITENPFAARDTIFYVSLVLLPLVWEALRRTAGLSLTLIFSVFIAYGFVGHWMPGMLKGVEQHGHDLIGFLGTSEVAMLGLPLKIITLTVVLFIWMGQLLLYTGASEWFTDLAAAMMGRSRGGSAKIAVIASGLFGSISGSAVSNVASTGVITIPLMRQAGYNAKTAGAIEAVASTGGQIMPPIMGAAAFLMAELLELSYTDIIIAALIPAFLYYLAVFVQADLEAAKNNIAPLREDQIPPMGKVLREGWFFSMPFVVLILTLFILNMPAQKSAFWAAITVVLVSNLFGYRGKRIGPMWSVPFGFVVFALLYGPNWIDGIDPVLKISIEKAILWGAASVILVSIIFGFDGRRQMWDSITGCGRASADIIIIGAMAGVIIGILDKTGLGQALTLILAAVGQDNLFLLLLLTAVISILLGMGMPTSAIYLLLATMIAPSLVKLGVHPIAAHMFVLYFGLMSMITPPVAIAAFAAASLAGANPMATGMTAVRLGWIAYIIPFVFVLSPELLMQGHWFEISTATITAVIGVWVASCGFVGFMFKRMNVLIQLLISMAGIALLMPAHAIEYVPPGSPISVGILINVAGAVLAALCIAYQSRDTGRDRGGNSSAPATGSAATEPRPAE